MMKMKKKIGMSRLVDATVESATYIAKDDDDNDTLIHNCSSSTDSLKDQHTLATPNSEYEDSDDHDDDDDTTIVTNSFNVSTHAPSTLISTPTQQDPIITALLSSRGKISDVSQSAEEERQRRMYVMLRWSHKYKKMQVESANAMWDRTGDREFGEESLEERGVPSAGLVRRRGGADSFGGGNGSKSLAEILAEAGDLDEELANVKVGGGVESQLTVAESQVSVVSNEGTRPMLSRSLTCDVLQVESGSIAPRKKNRKRCVTFVEDMDSISRLTRDTLCVIPGSRYNVDIDSQEQCSPSETPTIVTFQI